MNIENKYDIIYADPAWRYDFSKSKNRDIENQYPTMSVSEICELPISKITNDNCILYLWATAPKLIEALKVVDAWGFKYKTQAIWDKGSAGIGYWFRGQHEILIVATKGKNSPPKASLRCGSILRYPNQNRLARIKGKCNHHSLKPWEVKEMIKRWFPNTKRIELFSREKAEGFDAWGNEVDSDIDLMGLQNPKSGGKKIKTLAECSLNELDKPLIIQRVSNNEERVAVCVRCNNEFKRLKPHHNICMSCEIELLKQTDC